MAPPPPPPVERNGDVSSSPTAPTPFLTKTYQLVEDRSIDEVISWGEDGSSFVVWNPTVFARDMLPNYFKHNNFSSFVRQLNTYGFRKVMPDRWEFSNDCFRRGERRLLCDIQRRKVAIVSLPATAAVEAAAVIPKATVAVSAAILMISPSNSGEEQVISSQSSTFICGPHCDTVVMDENERLRKENVLLCKELTQMKSLCSNILTLMSNYANGRSEGVPDCARAIDLLPMCRSFGGGDGNASVVEEVVMEDGEEVEKVGGDEAVSGFEAWEMRGLLEHGHMLQLQQPGYRK